MPRFEKHLAIGVGVGVAAVLVYRALKPKDGRHLADAGELFWGASICGFGAVLPDILEPAFCPNHRSFCHSHLASGVLVFALYKLSKSTHTHAPLAKLLIAGYLSHLGADMSTPMGLPLVFGRGA